MLQFHLGYSIKINLPVIVVLCGVVLITEVSCGHITPRSDLTSQNRLEKFKDDPDFPVGETKEQRGVAKQEEAKEEAIESLSTKEELTVIPLVPAFAYSRNEGAYYGFLVPMLRTNKNGHLEDIVAPQYLHNKYLGESLGLHYYGYPSDTTQYAAVLSYSTKVAHEIDLSYQNVGAGGGRYLFYARANWSKNPFQRFFGIGNNAKESDESNYTASHIMGDLTIGVHLAQDLALMWSEKFHQVRIEKGIVNTIQQTQEQFSTINGIDGSDIWGHKLTLRYDTRDRQLISTQGTYINISREWNQNFKDNSNWWRTTFDLRHLIPHYHDRLVFVSHFYADTVNGGTAPFYERPTVGGQNTLRGFGLSRYVDNTAMGFNLEERVLVRQQEIFGYLLDFEIAPFLDIGRVGSHFGTNMLMDPRVNPGMGFRFLSRPHIVGRVDIAYGSDGANAFAGLDYPF
ncbi:MAG: BamA/TamA family outer membrane protein [Nitrospirota bacterium]